MNEEYGHIPDAFYLTQEEIDNLRKSKKELTDYGREKLRELMNKHTPNYIPDDDTLEEMLHLKLTEEKKEELEGMRRKENILRRYNHYYNLECASLPHGTPITPEHQQIIAFESMIDALRCENLNHEFDVVPIADIEDLIEGLRNQSNEFLKTVKEFKDNADGVA